MGQGHCTIFCAHWRKPWLESYWFKNLFASFFAMCTSINRLERNLSFCIPNKVKRSCKCLSQCGPRVSSLENIKKSEGFHSLLERYPAQSSVTLPGLWQSSAIPLTLRSGIFLIAADFHLLAEGSKLCRSYLDVVKILLVKGIKGYEIIFQCRKITCSWWTLSSINITVVLSLVFNIFCLKFFFSPKYFYSKFYFACIYFIYRPISLFKT